MTSALAFEDVSKYYRGGRGYVAFRDDIVVASKRLVGIGRPPRDVVRALDDVSFEIPEGQSTAIIGENGAGKTTALKLATRIAYPSTGTIRVRGRVGALIEVGTGMHPELTGRENVHLYGRILGLSRRDVESRFDEIIDFSGVSGAIDQPVKQYSSGMQLRLGFSIAAFLEPDVFIVDEAIAVGDAGFQHKCVERMSELVRDGRTLVFVSHDMSAVEVLCERAILLERGRLAMDGRSRDVVTAYMRKQKELHLERASAPSDFADSSTAPIQIRAVTFHDLAGRDIDGPLMGEPVIIRVHYSAREVVERPALVLGIRDGLCGLVAILGMVVDGQVPEALVGDGHIDCVIDELPLQPQTYELWGEFRGASGYGLLFDWQPLRTFAVHGEILGSGTSAVNHSLSAPMRLRYHWAVATPSVGPERVSKGS